MGDAVAHESADPAIDPDGGARFLAGVSGGRRIRFRGSTRGSAEEIGADRLTALLHRFRGLHRVLERGAKGLLGEDHGARHVGGQFFFHLGIELVTESTGGDAGAEVAEFRLCHQRVPAEGSDVGGKNAGEVGAHRQAGRPGPPHHEVATASRG